MGFQAKAVRVSEAAGRHAFDQVTLKTKRLTLRPFRADDAEPLFAIFSDPVVMRYWSSAPWASVERAHAMIASDLKAMSAGEYLRLGLELDGRVIGMCTLFDFNTQCRRAEIGYGMDSACWGSGYMHEALTALISYGFGELGLHRIEADVDPRNAGSVRSLERLGFVREGLLRERWIVEGEVSDSVVFGLLGREWVQGVGASGKP
jgi:RimJ/RimL family protein N-acetyltransferase